MNPLLPLMQAQEALSLDEQLETGTVSDALHDAFFTLAKAFGLPSSSASQVSFSVDSDETALGILRLEDRFAEEVVIKIGTPNAKVCHMRLYADDQGHAHWHSLFAEMDENGDLKQITITDSRLKGGVGITAQKDIESNEFLKSYSDKIRFLAGAQQPIGIYICWIHCLANLASLAATGRVYQPKTASLGIELAKIIEEADNPQEKPIKHEQIITIETPPPSPLSVEKSSPEVLRNSSNPYQLFPPKVDSQIDEDPSIALIKNTRQSSLDFKATGATSLFMGASTMIIGGLSLTPLLPLSFPVSMGLIGIGLILALAGLALLIGNSLGKTTSKLPEPNEDSVLYI
ncbi:Uncharacterised protein [Legionella lansingensis]|uniref:Uncharacterized protein n=1 Tax=Legionella lansingensis TaxID=45067 RepID=A0A0W0VG44_9GAMM|nr:hypothetical protein [Legionella lansingensis]KTD18617.1 hypothetical protein Llan_2463 [Legionella lansingensis]SNV46154.1 Uncharacterised protein [Legionella lansingensis]